MKKRLIIKYFELFEMFKNNAGFLLFTCIACCLFNCVHIYAEERTETVFKFPSSISYIEEEAFAGTSPGTIVFSEGLLEISERAFAEIHDLKAVYIPGSVSQISPRAFEGSRSFVVYGYSESTASDWAGKEGYPFVPVALCPMLLPSGRNVIHQSDSLIDRVLLVFMVEGIFLFFICTRRGYLLNMRPQARPELYVIECRFP